jgi:hypothetical protein
MKKGKRMQQTTEESSIEVNLREGEVKIESGNDFAIYLIIGLAAFFIYAKYWHRPAMAKIKKRRKK